MVEDMKHQVEEHESSGCGVWRFGYPVAETQLSLLCDLKDFPISISWNTWGQNQRCWDSIATLRNSPKHAYWGFELVGKVQRWCSIAKSILIIVSYRALFAKECVPWTPNGHTQHGNAFGFEVLRVCKKNIRPERLVLFHGESKLKM